LNLSGLCIEYVVCECLHVIAFLYQGHLHVGYGLVRKPDKRYTSFGCDSRRWLNWRRVLRVADGIGGLGRFVRPGVASIAIDNSSQRFGLIPMQRDRSQVAAKCIEKIWKRRARELQTS
jgi:hypothetical protein